MGLLLLTSLQTVAEMHFFLFFLPEESQDDGGLNNRHLTFSAKEMTMCPPISHKSHSFESMGKRRGLERKNL